jgi:hypothetical protein
MAIQARPESPPVRLRDSVELDVRVGTAPAGPHMNIRGDIFSSAVHQPVRSLLRIATVLRTAEGGPECETRWPRAEGRLKLC